MEVQDIVAFERNLEIRYLLKEDEDVLLQFILVLGFIQLKMIVLVFSKTFKMRIHKLVVALVL